MKATHTVLVSLLCVAIGAAAIAATTKSTAKGEWSMNATAIESCSCPMFCPCYFGSGHPAGHHDMSTHSEEHYCRFNMAFKVNKGSYKGATLDGAKFWIGGDLGGDFSQGKMDWAVVTFDKATTQAQRDGIVAIVGKLYPVQWNSLTTGEGEISWNDKAPNSEAVAKLDGGKTAEVVLKRGGFGEKGRTPVIKDLQYWGADHNSGFVLMPNAVNAWRGAGKPFETHDTNGFMITVDIADKPMATNVDK